ncbi:MAG: MarR family transcriptional regulator [Candidatus Spyradosoma sp.]
MTAELVLDFIRANPGANHYAIAAEFKRTIKSVTRHTRRLRKKKLVVFRGTPRDGGFYAR